MVGVSSAKTKIFSGATHLRYRLVLSTLSATPVRITNIREHDSTSPGLSPSEISLIRLFDKITSGAVIQINETGTTLNYKPGLLICGDRLIHECHPSRSIAYYLEPLLMLAPFAKFAINITLRGPTHGEADICADTVAAVSVPLLRRLTVGTSLSPQVDVRRRAAQSHMSMNGGGRGGIVTFRCDILTAKIPAIDVSHPGVIKRVRGIAFGNRISPGHVSRMVESARAVLNRFSPDVYVHTDHNNTPDCGIGFGMHLVAESTEGCLLAADWSCSRKEPTPEMIAQAAVAMLLEEVEAGGCLDSNHTCLALLFCALSDSDLSRVTVGRLTDAAVCFLRDLEVFFGVRFNVRMLGSAIPKRIKDDEDEDNEDEDEEEEESSDDDSDEENAKASKKHQYGVILSCIGVGLSNVARQRF